MENTIPLNERRSSHRQEFQGDLSEILLVEGSDQEFRAAAENISSKGLGIRTMQQLPLNQPFVLKLRDVELVLTVVWSKPSSHLDGTYNTGLYYADQEVDLFNVIQQFTGCRLFT